jgi:hypothetical protein
MENKEEKESLPKRLRNGLVAIGCMILIGGFVHYSTSQESIYKDPQDVVKLEYDALQVYEVQADTINEKTKSPCKIVKTTVEFDIVSRDLVVQIGDQPPITYTDGTVSKDPRNLVVTNSQKFPVVFMRDHNDSTMFVYEQPYFIVLSKGKECRNLDN